VVDDSSDEPIRLDVKVIRNEVPKGLAVCRNMGVEKAKGDVVAFIDDAIADHYG
jgi:glycosyltransferase involved in cell wall biosynthesis